MKIFKKLSEVVLGLLVVFSLCLSGLVTTVDIVQAASSVSGVSTVSNMPSNFIKGVDKKICNGFFADEIAGIFIYINVTDFTTIDS